MRHGLRAGRLPKGCGYVVRDCDEFRRILEDATLQAHDGQVGVYQAAVIQTAVRWERHAMLAQRWLRLHYEEMSATDRLAYSRDIARASQERDRCLRDLKLDAQARADILATLYSDEVPSKPPGSPPADRRAESG